MFCVNCGAEIDDKAVICVHCGCQITPKQAAPKKDSSVAAFLWLLFFFPVGLYFMWAKTNWKKGSKIAITAILVVLFLLILPGNGSDDPTPTEPAGTSASQTTDPTDPATDPIEQIPEDTAPEITVYESGMYKVGSDIPAGEYLVTADPGKSAYVSCAKDSSGTLSSIVANENVSSFFYMTVSDGQYFTVKRGTFVSAADAVTPSADENGFYSAGMYRVGKDIPAGEYFIISDIGENAYVEVNSDSLGTLHSIVANENVESFYFTTVFEGQYFKVRHGTFISADLAEVPGPNEDGQYGEGMYRVGQDIPAGEYKILPSAGERAYIEVNSDSIGTLNSIVSNENTSDPIYITVVEGQYLLVSRASFEPAS